VVGDQQAVRRYEEAGAGAFDLSVLVLDGQQVDGRPGLFGEGAEIGNLGGWECGRGEEQEKTTDPKDHPFN